MLIRNLTIRYKLMMIIMLTSVLSLFVASVSFFAISYNNSRAHLVSHLLTQGEMVADNCKAAVVFDSPEDAKKSLSNLRLQPGVVYACVNTIDGQKFASYSPVETSGEIDVSCLEGRSYYFGDKLLTISADIVSNESKIATVYIQSNLDYLNDIFVTNIIIVSLILLGASFIAFLVSSRLQLLISKPILYLSEIAQEVTKNKEYTLRAVKQGDDEIGILIDSFNEMLNTINDHKLELIKVNSNLEDEVAKRTADLEETVSKLHESNQQLKDFTYIASHDLREPLRKVSSFGMILKESLGDKLSGDDLESFNFMIDGAERMNGMIEGLLTYSRVSTKAQPSEVIDVNESLEELKKFELGALIEETGALVEVCDELGSVKADPIQLRQLFQNLISNGIKYQESGNVAHIKISSKSASNGMLRIEVSDNGIGIDPEFYENIFVMFKRLHKRGEYEGTGIGLAVCKKIVDRHGGSIGVEAGEDGGSVFWFTMPCAEVKAAVVSDDR